MHAPIAITTFPDFILSEGGSMAVFDITKTRMIFRFIATPGIIATTVTYQKLMRYFILFKIPDKESLLPGVNSHINQNTEILIHIFSLAKL